MRLNIVILLLILSPAYFTQAPGVKDAHFLSQRHTTFIDLIDVGGKVWDDLHEKYINQQLTSLTTKESSFLENRFFGFYPQKIGIPYLNLFHEDDHWALRTYKSVNLETSFQGVFWDKGPVRHLYFRESDKSIRTDTIYNYHGNNIFKKIIEEGIKTDQISPYLNDHYDLNIYKKNLLDTNARDSLASLIPSCNKMVIKEDYYYNKQTGITESEIISIGFYKDDLLLVYTYFPELSYSLRDYFAFFDDDLNLQFNTNFDEILKRQWYNIEKIAFDAYRIDDIGWRKMREEDSKLNYLTEMNALFYVSLLKSYVLADYRNFTGQINVPVHNNLTLKTTLENGQIQGKCMLTSADDKPTIEVTFKNHIPHGDYFEYYPNGKIKETGKFEMGLKTGLWMNYFKGGEKMAQRNYLRGWLNGEQTFWYQNSQEYLKFNYSNFMLNGPFQRYKVDGSLSESGYFTNNFPDKSWQINLALPETCVNIVQKNKDLDWLYAPEAYSDGVLSYSVELTQEPRKTNCPVPFYTCVSLLSISEVE